MDQLVGEDFKDDVFHPDELSGHEKLKNAQRQWIQVSAAKGRFHWDVPGCRRSPNKNLNIRVASAFY